MTRLLLTTAIIGYRMIPGPLRKTCPRTGPSCSALGLQAVRAGLGLGDVRQIIRECGDFCPYHGARMEDLCDSCFGPSCG